MGNTGGALKYGSLVVLEDITILSLCILILIHHLHAKIKLVKQGI